MENAVSMHMVYSFNELVHVVLNPVFGQITASSFNRIIHIHVHQLEDKGKSPGRLIVEHLIQLDDLRMW